MNRIKNILKNALVYWLNIIVYLWPSFFIGNGVFGLTVSILLDNRSEFLVRISEIIACIVVQCVLLFVFAYKRGYKKAEFHIVSLLISLMLAAGMQLIYAKIFRYAEYTTAGAYYLAHMIYAGSNQEVTLAYYDVPGYTYIIAMLIADFFYIVSTVFGEYLGNRKRLKERADLNTNE